MLLIHVKNRFNPFNYFPLKNSTLRKHTYRLKMLYLNEWYKVVINRTCKGVLLPSSFFKQRNKKSVKV